MLIPILAQFQSPIPVNPGTVSLLGPVTQALNALVDPTSNIFLGAKGVHPKHNPFSIRL